MHEAVGEVKTNPAVWDDEYFAPEILPVDALLIDEVIVICHHHKELF